MQKHTEVIETETTRRPEHVDSTAPPLEGTSAARPAQPLWSRRVGSGRLEQAVYLVFGLLETLLLIRFVLRALGANPDAGFAQAVYGVTGWLIAPFIGLFGTPQLASGPAFELHTLIALAVYAAAGYFLARTARLAVGEGGSARLTRARS